MGDQTRSGTTFGPYRLGRLIGRGGMGEVYEARDTVRERTVALKLLPSALAEDENYRIRFDREARLAGMLSDPHVIPIHDFGEIAGVLFIDMRLVRGEDVSEVLRREGRLEPQRAVAVLRQVAGALDEAHRNGLVHRDVKPANIMLTGDGFAYLADFGIATRDTDDRITDDGSAVGSFAYMAPERFEGHQATARSDVYSLAATFHELVTGEPPFPGRSVSELIRAHLFEEPAGVSTYNVDPAYDVALQRALAKDPRDRFATAGDFVAALASAATTGATTGATTSRSTSPDRTAQSAPSAKSASAAPRVQQRSSRVGPTGPTTGNPPGTTSGSRPRRRSRALPIAVIVVAVLVMSAVGALAYLRGRPTDAAGASSVTSTVTRSTPITSPMSSTTTTGSAAADPTISFASTTGYTACTMNAAAGVTCVSLRRNYTPASSAAAGCGWSIHLGDSSPGFVCDPQTFPDDSQDGQAFGATARRSTRIGTYPVLAVGQAAAVGPYVCSMTSDYVTCRNAQTGEGFRLAGSSYRLRP